MRRSTLFFFALFSFFGYPLIPSSYGSSNQLFPTIRQVEISPDGSKILLLRAIEKNYYAFVINLKDNSKNPVMASDPGSFSLNWCKWANEQKIICSGSGTIETKARGSKRGPSKEAGTMEGRLMYVVNHDGSKAMKLIKKNIPKASEKEPKYDSPIQDGVISWLPASPDEILIQYNREHLQWPSVYRLNINKNKLKRVRKYREQVVQWLADKEGTVKLGIGFKDERMRLFSMESNSTREIDPELLADVLPAFPVGLSPDGSTVYLERTNKKGGQTIVGLALNDSKGSAELFSVAKLNSSEDLYSPAALRGTGMRKYVPEMPIEHLIGGEPKKIFTAVQDAIPGNKEALVSRTNDWEKFIVYAWSGKTYSYYLYDTSKKQLLKLGGN